MDQGDEGLPGERVCPDCERRFYSAAMLADTEATCPQCGSELEPARAGDDPLSPPD